MRRIAQIERWTSAIDDADDLEAEIPVRLSRVFRQKPERRRGFFGCNPASRGPKSRKFPVFSLMIREFDAENSSPQTASPAIQSVLVHYIPEIAANSRVGGLIRSARGSGESDQSCKSPIRPDSSQFRRDFGATSGLCPIRLWRFSVL